MELVGELKWGFQSLLEASRALEGLRWVLLKLLALASIPVTYEGGQTWKMSNGWVFYPAAHYEKN